MNGKMNFLKQYLQSGNRESSMRLALIWGIILSSVVMLVMCFIAIYSTMNGIAIDWAGMAWFLGSLSTFMGVLVYGKVSQKRQEYYDGYNGNNGYGNMNPGNNVNAYNSDIVDDSVNVNVSVNPNTPPSGKII